MLEPAIKKLPFIQVKITDTPLVFQQFYAYGRYTISCKRRVESMWRVERRVDSFREVSEYINEWRSEDRVKADAEIFYEIEDDYGLVRVTPLMTDADWVMAILCDAPQ